MKIEQMEIIVTANEKDFGKLDAFSICSHMKSHVPTMMEFPTYKYNRKKDCLDTVNTKMHLDDARLESLDNDKNIVVKVIYSPDE